MKISFDIFKILLMMIGVVMTSDVQITLHPHSLNQMFKHEIKMGEKQVFAMRPDPLHAGYLGLDLVVDNIQVVEVTPGEVEYKESTRSILLKSNFIRAIGQYNAIYKTRREGHFQVELHSVTSEFHMSDDFKPTGCNVHTGQINIIMTPMLPEPIVEKLKSEIKSRMQLETCSSGEKVVSDVFERLSTAFVAEDIAQGSNPSHYTHEVVFDTEVDDDAVKLTVSEDVINRELAKLYETANIKFLWGDLPEVRRMLRECPVEVDCSSFLIGDLHSTLHGAPEVQIASDSASVRIPLTTTLTYGQKIILSVDTVLTVNIASLHINGPSKHGRVSWKPEYRLVDLTMTRFYSSKRLHWLKDQLEEILNGSQMTHVETLLTEYLHGHLPLQVHGVHWRPTYAEFAAHRLIFHVTPHLARL